MDPFEALLEQCAQYLAGHPDDKQPVVDSNVDSNEAKSLTKQSLGELDVNLPI